MAHGQKRQIELYDSSHCLYALDYLNYLREQGDLCDATFRFDTNEVYAHRNILTGATPYFEGLLEIIYVCLAYLELGVEYTYNRLRLTENCRRIFGTFFYLKSDKKTGTCLYGSVLFDG